MWRASARAEAMVSRQVVGRGKPLVPTGILPVGSHPCLVRNTCAEVSADMSWACVRGSWLNVSLYHVGGMFGTWRPLFSFITDDPSSQLPHEGPTQDWSLRLVSAGESVWSLSHFTESPQCQPEQGLSWAPAGLLWDWVGQPERRGDRRRLLTIPHSCRHASAEVCAFL